MRGFLWIIFLWVSSTTVLAVAPQRLSGPTLPASQLVQKEVDRLYSPSAASILPGAVAPFGDANAFMNGIRNIILDIEVNEFNNALYLQNYGADGASGAVFADHYSMYCADSSPNEKIPGGQCQKDPLLQYADINVSNILSGPRLEGERANAAKVSVTTLIQPFPSATYLDNKGQLIKEKLTDANYRQGLADALAKQAILSPARGALAEMIAKRTPLSTSKGSLSMMEVLEKGGAERYLNQDWQAKIQQIRDDALAAKPANFELAVLCDIAKSSAYQDRMAYEQYHQGERIATLLSALISLNYRQAEGLSSAVGTSVTSP